MNEAIKLEPGTYVLTETIQNPNPDRRVRTDWRKMVEWPEGARVCVVKWGYGEKRNLASNKMWMGSYSGDSFTDGADRETWNLIASKLERLEETPSMWLSREHGGLSLAREILDELVKDGVVTLERIQAAAKEILDRR